MHLKLKQLLKKNFMKYHKLTMCCFENWILQQSSKTSQFKKTKYMQCEIMPDKFATCTVKHIFKKQLPKKKAFDYSKSSEFLS